MEPVGARTKPFEDQTKIVDVNAMEWKEFDKGIEAKILYQDEETGASTVLFRFAPGSQAPLHEHTGLEQTYVIEGELEDHDGVVTAGNFAVRQAGSVHAASTRVGSLHLAFFSRPPRRVHDGSDPFSNAEGDSK